MRRIKFRFIVEEIECLQELNWADIKCNIPTKFDKSLFLEIGVGDGIVEDGRTLLDFESVIVPVDCGDEMTCSQMADHVSVLGRQTGLDYERTKIVRSV